MEEKREETPVIEGHFNPEPEFRPEESPQETLEDLYRLSHEDQKDLLMIIAPRVLGRLLEPERRRFIDELRQVPLADAHISEPEDLGPPKESRETVLDHFFRQPFDSQLHLLRLAAPRIVAPMVGAIRERFLLALDDQLRRAEKGESLEPVTP